MIEIKSSYKYFYKVGWRYLSSPEDVDDYVQTCMELLVDAGECATLSVCAKAGLRTFYSSYKGIGKNNRKRYEFLASNIEAIENASHTYGIADIMDTFVPANPNDALSQKLLRVQVNESKIYFDKYDLAEVCAMKPQSVKAAKNTNRPLVVWRVENDFFPSINAVARAKRCRASNAKLMAERVVLSWA